MQLPHALWFLSTTAKGVVKLYDLPRAVVEHRLGSTNFNGSLLKFSEAPVVIKPAHLQPKRVDLFQNRILRRLKFGDRRFLFGVPATHQPTSAKKEKKAEMLIHKTSRITL